MRCVVCYLDQASPIPDAQMTVNGHSVCSAHVRAAARSTSIKVVMTRLHTMQIFDEHMESQATEARAAGLL